ncbi:MAG: Crp/Fnr family transcriptional regulator [Flavobacteriaceae bacterium]|nr:MAG: Crp/Fnr family transcriptional regulator [Flavobacteriaceae bacterium]
MKRKNSLFSDLSEEELVILDENRYSVFYKSGEVICKAGTKPLGLICLNRGKVKIVRRGMNGINQILGLRKALDFLGFKAFISGERLLSTTIALEESQVCVIDRKNFFEVVEKNNDLAKKIMRFLAKELRNTDNRLVNLTQKHLRGRLAETLLMIYDTFGTDPKSGYLKVRLKRYELAALSNMNTANAIRVLGSFKKANLLVAEKQNIRLIDLKALKEISDFDK